MKTEEGSARGPNWSSLITIGVVGLVLSAAIVMVLLIEGIEPFSLVSSLLFVGALILVTRGVKWAAIALLVLCVLWTAASFPFIMPGLFTPASGLDFVAAGLQLVSTVVIFIGALGIARSRTAGGAPRKVLAGAAAVMVVVVAVGVVSRLGFDDAEAESGDATLVAEEIDFAPADIEVASGDAVFVDNKDMSLHTFAVDDLDLDEPVPGGTGTRVVIDAEPGEYEYYCSLPGHEEDMKGTLTVR